jgi:hypothetical protein
MIEKPFTEESIKLGTGRVSIWAKQDSVHNFHNKMIRLVSRIFFRMRHQKTQKNLDTKIPITSIAGGILVYKEIEIRFEDFTPAPSKL